MRFSDKAGWILSGLMLIASSVYAENSIIALDASDIDNGTTIIKVEFAQPLIGLPAGAGFIINNPDTSPRIVLDFPDTANGLGKSDQNFSAGNLRSANIVQIGKNARLVIHLDRVLTYNTKIN